MRPMPPTLRLHDTMTGEVKPLETAKPGRLTFYSCGPTVYSNAHIGNFRTFLTGDLIVRTAQALGWEVEYVTNITDVGHLTEDDVADAGGQDKMAKALASKDGQQFANVWDLAGHYEEAFREDWAALNLVEPNVRPRATQHMREQIQMIEDLIKRGHAYETEDAVYFSVESFADYGKLSGNRDQDSLERGVREVKQDTNKRHPADFALWKKDDAHLMQWHSPWGWGFPGWHLECSVMAMKYLGETLDLHAGGEDLVFPHHECEIAQSEAITGKPFANHWVHTRFLQVEGEKMSKSAGTFHTVRDLVEEGVDPRALRWALTSVPFMKPLNFTQQGLKDAARNIGRLDAAWEAVEGHEAGAMEGDFERLDQEMVEALCDNLNTSVALAKALEGIRLAQQSPGPAARAFLDRVESVLGFAGPSDDEPCDERDEPAIEGKPISEWIEVRASAKKAKDFAEADRIRDLLVAQGIELVDTPDGTDWKKA